MGVRFRACARRRRRRRRSSAGSSMPSRPRAACSHNRRSPAGCTWTSWSSGMPVRGRRTARTASARCRASTSGRCSASRSSSAPVRVSVPSLPVRTGTGPYFSFAPSWIQVSWRVRSTHAIRPLLTGHLPALLGFFRPPAAARSCSCAPGDRPAYPMAGVMPCSPGRLWIGLAVGRRLLAVHRAAQELLHLPLVRPRGRRARGRLRGARCRAPSVSGTTSPVSPSSYPPRVARSSFVTATNSPSRRRVRV